MLQLGLRGVIAQWCIGGGQLEVVARASFPYEVLNHPGHTVPEVASVTADALSNIFASKGKNIAKKLIERPRKM
jgi:hypothetical protein